MYRNARYKKVTRHILFLVLHNYNVTKRRYMICTVMDVTILEHKSIKQGWFFFGGGGVDILTCVGEIF